jgi:hypothetical protein
MMTGILGILMWLMMAAMLTGLAAGGIAWLRRGLKRPTHNSPAHIETDLDLKPARQR